MAKTSLRPGAVLELRTPKGLAYVQYVGKHPEYGDVIRVLRGLYDNRCTNFAEVTEQPAYFGFYSAHAAVKEGLVEIVSTIPLAENVGVPDQLRRAGARERGGKVLTWIVENGGVEQVRQSLSELERKLPIAAIWDHELLIRRISSGWTPEQEG